MTDPTSDTPAADATDTPDASVPSPETPTVAEPSAEASGEAGESGGEFVPTEPRAADQMSETEVAVLDAMKTVIDPELMVNIVDLGLVYDVRVGGEKADVMMTLTSPACPVGPQIVHQAKMAVESVPEIVESEIRLTMSPPWSPERMTDDARDQLGIF